MGAYSHLRRLPETERAYRTKKKRENGSIDS
jgi:hypothetical protein